MSTIAFWAATAGKFAEPSGRFRRIVQWLCYALVAISIAVGLAQIVRILTLWYDPVSPTSALADLPFGFAFLAAATCVMLAINATQGAEHQRAIWSLVPPAFLIFAGFGADAAQGIVTSYAVAWANYYVAAAVVIVTPLVLTYVALNRRLLDIDFVLNRAAVFAIVSTILIGAFVLFEWIANEWLSANHPTSAIVGAIVALALGLSMRFIHRFVDRLVDRVLFRKRHEDEAALRRFAHEAAYISERSTLRARALRTVKESTGADASIAVLDGESATIDENDPARVALRAWHKPVDLELLPDSALRGQFAFPMVSQDPVVAVLVCGTKADSEAYTPDESDALVALAQGVGSALALLGPERNGHVDSVAATLAELRAAISDLRELRPQ